MPILSVFDISGTGCRFRVDIGGFRCHCLSCQTGKMGATERRRDTMSHQYFSARKGQITRSGGTGTLVQRAPLRGTSRLRGTSPRLWLSGSLAAILTMAMISFAASAAHAVTTIVVTTTADETVVDGNCSLEEAIQA